MTLTFLNTNEEFKKLHIKTFQELQQSKPAIKLFRAYHRKIVLDGHLKWMCPLCNKKGLHTEPDRELTKEQTFDIFIG